MFLAVSSGKPKRNLTLFTYMSMKLVVNVIWFPLLRSAL